jgi:hypothetical protein
MRIQRERLTGALGGIPRNIGEVVAFLTIIPTDLPMPALIRSFPLRRFVLTALAALLVPGCGTAPDLPSGPPLTPLGRDIDDAPPAIAGLSTVPRAVPAQTYDGSGQLVHPDVFVAGRSWNERRYWFLATPYPNGDPAVENPSLYAGAHGLDWTVPQGVSNPLAIPWGVSYLSDPDIVHDPVTDDVFAYYREAAIAADRIWVRKSRDGIRWEAPVQVIDGERNGVISPAVVREEDGSWRMWSVAAGGGGCRSHAPDVEVVQRRSRDGLEWGRASPAPITISGWAPWHLDVQYLRSRHEYLALVAAYPDGATCASTSLFLAESEDGTSWNVAPRPLLAAGEIDSMRDLVYRSSFRYFAATNEMTVWYSGATLENGEYKYSLAVARYPFDELMRRVRSALPPADRVPVRTAPRSVADRAAIQRFIDHFP